MLRLGPQNGKKQMVIMREIANQNVNIFINYLPSIGQVCGGKSPSKMSEAGDVRILHHSDQTPSYDLKHGERFIEYSGRVSGHFRGIWSDSISSRHVKLNWISLF